MFKITMILSLSVASSIALAQVAVPTDAQIAADKAACEKKYDPSAAHSSLKVSIALARELCKGQVDVRALEAKAQAAGSKNQAIEQELARQRASLDQIARSLKALESAPKAEPKGLPAQATPTIPAEIMSPVVMGGPPPQTIQPPGQYVVSTVPLQGMVSPIQIYNLSRAALYHVGDNQEIRVEFIKNGQALPGPPNTFELFYSPNKKGPPIAHRGIDPALVPSVYTSCQLNDDIQVIYYTWDGSFINGTSFPAWRRVAKVQFFNFGPKFNSWRIDAVSGLKTP